MFTFEHLRKEKIDVYAILGINNLAEDDQIRKAYRTQALKYHPDKNPSDEAKSTFQLISDAYNFLTSDNKEERLRYDQWLQQYQDNLLHKGEVAKNLQEKRDQLERLEKEYYEQVQLEEIRSRKIDQLRLQSEKLKRQANFKNNSSINKPIAKISDDYRTVNVKWRLKDSLNGLFVDEVLFQLMSEFGPIKNCVIIKEQEKYGYGEVIFETIVSVDKAMKWKEDKVWENSRFKSLGKLIKEIKRKKDQKELQSVLQSISSAESALEDFKEAVLMKMSQVV